MLRNRKAGCSLGLLAVATLLLLTLGWAATASQGAQVSYFVAPNGDDAAEGSQRAPFATLERARDAVRALKRTSGLPPGGVSVYLRGGSHRLLRTFALGPQDSGTEGAPITYGAYRGEEVRLVGGADLDPEAFRPVADAEVLRRLPRAARGEVFAIDLRAQGLTDYGELLPYGKIHDAVDDPNIKPPVPVPPELFFNGTSLTLARWPNEGFATVGTVIDRGSVPRDGDPGNCGGTFMYGGERPSRWTDAEDLWLYGFWQYDWADAALKVATIDPERRRITLAMASHYGLRSGGRFYAFNLLEELDAPGEWYLDRRAGILYLYPPGPLADATVQLSTLEGPMVSLTNTSHVSLRGLTFEVGRGSGVAIRGGSSNLVADSTLRLLGEQAVVIRGGERHGVTGSEVYATGAGGIVLEGGDRATLRPAGHVALNNHLHDYARIQRTYSPAVSLSGVGNRAAHNLIHDAPHLAIGLSGNDHMIKFNEIYEVVQETADAGAIYMGRGWTARGNVIRYNFIHDIPYEDTQGIYLDDAAKRVLPARAGRLYRRRPRQRRREQPLYRLQRVGPA